MVQDVATALAYNLMDELKKLEKENQLAAGQRAIRAENCAQRNRKTEQAL